MERYRVLEITVLIELTAESRRIRDMVLLRIGTATAVIMTPMASTARSSINEKPRARKASELLDWRLIRFIRNLP